MADSTIDRGGQLSADTIPGDGVAGLSPGGGHSVWQTIAIAGGAAALIGAIGGISIGYGMFHKSGSDAPAATPARASEQSLADVLANPAAQRAQLAGQLGQNPAMNPDGTVKTDVFGKPIQNNNSVVPGPEQPGQQNSSAGSQPPPHRVNQAVVMATAARRSPIMAFGGGNLYGSPPPASTSNSQGQSMVVDEGAAPAGPPIGFQGFGRGNGGSNNPDSAAGRGSTDFSGQLEHSAVQTVRATLIANRSFLLSAGTIIPCTLQTAINSTQSGYVNCVINHDVYSEDGRIVLLDKGTKVLGQYSGGINQGQARLFVLWTRALTPRGIAIDLGSPAADSLGRSGLQGGVDAQFFARFGAALMLSILEDLSNVASSAVANQGTYTAQVPSQMGQTILQNTVNIKPILRKNQGDTAAIFVAKDFDFRSVYDVQLRR